MLFKGRAAVETALNEGKLVVSTAQTAGVKTLGFWLTVASSIGAIAALATDCSIVVERRD